MEEGKSHFAVEKPGKHYLNQMIKVTSTGDKSGQQHLCLTRWDERFSLLQASSSRLITPIMRKNSPKSYFWRVCRLKDSLQNTLCQHSSKLSRSWKTRLRNCQSGEETKETWYLNAEWYLELNFGTKRCKN